MRASRLLSILLLLQTRGRMTAQQLADRLEVSVRTIYRDVDSLHAAGVPLYGEAGLQGGYQLLEGYRTQLTGLTTDEAESLFLAGLPGPAAELGLGAVVTTAQLKLMAALPAELRERAERIQDRFHLDAPGWYRPGEPVPRLAAVADAVWNQRQTRVRYRRWAAPREVIRTLEPLALVLKAGTWYLVARSVDGSRQPRTYRVSQILELHTLDDVFERPEDFNIAAYWAGYLAEFEARRYQGEATVRLSPAGVARLADTMGQVYVAALSASAPDEAGWITATIPIESMEHTVGELLRLGPQVEVLAPAELRERVGTTAAGIAAIYAAG